MTKHTLESIRYQEGPPPSLQVLDQLLLPSEKTYIDVPNITKTWSVIKNMQIRGAPLIAIVAVCGLAVDLCGPSCTDLDTTERLNGKEDCGPAVLAYIQGKMDYLCTSRPTAVNLFNAMDELKERLTKALTNTTSPRERLVQTVCDYAQYCLYRDRSDNHHIGQHGADIILANRTDPTKKVTIMTICNTGTLATSTYGTALGVVRALHARGQLHKVVALETRPYNQGSRLTAFEIVHDDLPGVLICDSMAASYMTKFGVDACVVGGDRVCANGDTANKIGTFNLSLVAAAHNVPVYVAAPLTTLDASCPQGDAIPIEERPPDELLSTSRAPANIPVFNPAFDVTPHRYLAGVITEKGVILPDTNGNIDAAGFAAQQEGSRPAELVDRKKVESVAHKLGELYDYHEQSVASLPAYLATHAKAAMDFLGATSADDLMAVEMGDGNLNLVFIVTNTATQKQVIVKQALPYVRCVGESWPMTLERGFFEYTALTAQKKACPEFVPSVHFFSKPHALIVMEYLAPPNIVLRKGLIQGIRYPTMASDMGTFCALTLFQTSGFRLSTIEMRERVGFWSRNSQMCGLTEQVVFTEPYIEASNNRWTSPQLDEDKKAIENDEALKLAAGKLKHKFVTETQALIHADLHSGSVMASPAEGQTFVIDPEFAFYGAMGFDLGAFIGNLFLAYTSQPGHDNRNDYAEWILRQIHVFWKSFRHEFLKQWNDPGQHTGYLYSRETIGSEAVQRAQDDFFQETLTDTLGFAGMKMLRRVVGIAHVEDLDSISDADVRAQCERHALEIAKVFIKSASSLGSIDEAIQLARDKKP